MTFSITIVDGKPVVKDSNGNPLDWVHTVDHVLDPDGRPILYLGTFDFSTTITLGTPTATPPAPAPPVNPVPPTS